MIEQRRRSDLGAIILGLVLVLAGIYFVLRNTLGYALPEIDWNLVWPIVLVLFGVGVLTRAWSGNAERTAEAEKKAE